MKKNYFASFWYKFHNPTSKKYSCPTIEFGKILTENTIILEQNNKQKLQILKVLHIRNIQPKLNRIILNPVLMYLNVYNYWWYS